MTGKRGADTSRSSEATGSLSAWPGNAAALLDRAAGWLERSRWLLPGVLVALFLVHAWTASLQRPLWHDEIFTFLLARAPDWRTLMRWTHIYDLNPPLSHALVRGSLKLFRGVLGDRQATRLPFLLCVAACALLVDATLRRWTGSRVWSALGLAVVLWAYAPYAIEARPYALQAACLSVAVLAWLRSSRAARADPQDRALWLVVLAASLAAGLLSHVFFALLWFAFLLAESVDALVVERLDWQRFVAILLPLPVTLLYRPLLAQHAVAVYPLKYQPKLLVTGWFYAVSGWQLLWVLLPGLVAAALLGRRAVRAGITADRQRDLLRRREAGFAALLLTLGAMPGVMILYLHFTHGAFFWRYGFVVFYVLALVVPLLLWRASRGRPATGLLLLASVALLHGDVPAVTAALLHPRVAFHQPPTAACAACALADRLAPGLPLVDSNGLDWVEMNMREPPERLRHVFYLTGRAEAIQYAHATLFEGITEERAGFHFLASTEPYAQFVAEHPRFVVYGTRDAPEQWLLRKLAGSGAQLTLLGTVDPSDYHDNEVWLVQMPR